MNVEDIGGIYDQRLYRLRGKVKFGARYVDGGTMVHHGRSAKGCFMGIFWIAFGCQPVNPADEILEESYILPSLPEAAIRFSAAI